MTGTVVLAVTCGCGWKSQTSEVKNHTLVLAEAKNHTQKTGHTLTINGLVRPGEVKK